MPMPTIAPMLVTDEQINALSNAQRETYRLHAQGLRSPEIAAKTGRSLANVRVTLSHARVALGMIVAGTVTKRRKSMAEAAADAIKMNKRLAAEPICTRCLIHGHVAGDPDLCLPTARTLTSQSVGGLVLTREWK